MQLKCNRFIFSYASPAEEVESFILRSADLAEQTYGRDSHFSRLNQVLNQARFLGWALPHFSPDNIPDEIADIPPPGIDHIFETQAKLLVDVAPITRVALTNGDYCPVKMVCGTTAAGDLVWKCHLLSDNDGCPFIQKQGKRLKVKTKGTRIICQTQSLPYEEKYLFECFGGEEEGIWPMPFLPEFFSDQAIAQKFSPEVGVVEVVTIDEREPVRVLARELVPWYRTIVVDKTKALSFEDYTPNNFGEEHPTFDPSSLVSGWDTISENQQITLKDTGDYDEGDYDDDAAQFINVTAELTPSEESYLNSLEQALQETKIASKQEAEELRKDPKHKERAEAWLLNAVNRLQLIANYEKKIGAVVSILNRHKDQQVLVIQPRQKWASNLVDNLKKRGFNAHLLSSDKDKKLLRQFYDGNIDILITSTPMEELFIEDLVIISVTSFSLIKWLDWLNPSHLGYSIAVKQFGFTDHNLVPEHPNLNVETEDYAGPGFDVLKLNSSVSNTETKQGKAQTMPKTKTKTKPKFKIKIVGSKGRPKTAISYEKAMKIAKKFEDEGKKVEVFGPENDKDVFYSTGMPEVLQGELE